MLFSLSHFTRTSSTLSWPLGHSTLPGGWKLASENLCPLRNPSNLTLGSKMLPWIGRKEKHDGATSQIIG